jgi:acyl-CoA thioesterase YciA
VRIETWARKRGGKRAEKVTEGVFTYVAVDEEGHPRTLPAAAGDEG